jgi:FMN phosphatase YigB (HAD superfamily)
MRLKMTIKNITIFDLDGTVIDSSHRQATKPDGTLDLAHWFENATPEKIFRDKVLPLAQQIRKRSKKGDYTMICTARTLSDADLEFFHQEGLLVDKIISRKQGDMTPDGELKAKQLRSFFSLKQFKDLNKVMFDDAPSVRKSLRRLGISVIDPSKIQSRVA